MGFKVTIGQYHHADSVLHKLDPRFKLIAVFAFIVLVFIAQNTWQQVALGLVLLTLSSISKLPLRLVLGSLKPILPFIVLTMILNLFFIKTGEPLYTLGFLTITDESFYMALLVGLRFIYLMLAGSLIALCTSPIRLTDASEYLIKPFEKIGVPAHELAMMMSIALRFIPTLASEAEKIMKAQMARGVCFDEGGLIKRAQSFIPIVVPLFASSLRHAENLALAMDARCYEGSEGRTHYHPLKLAQRDAYASVVALIFIICFILLGIYT